MLPQQLAQRGIVDYHHICFVELDDWQLNALRVYLYNMVHLCNLRMLKIIFLHYLCKFENSCTTFVWFKVGPFEDH